MRIRRPLLLPLVPLYAAALAIKQRLFQMGWQKQDRLANPVISVGSISVGGAGKTPLVLMLTGILRRRGYAVRILTRGYGRTSDRTERVEPYGDALVHGDEPILLAQRSGAAVFTGADRYHAGLLAEQDEELEKIVVHVLDDGFQHSRLHRDIDIVLLTLEDLEDNLLPAGNLREPLTAMRRADVIVLREEEADRLQPIVDRITGRNPPLATWIVQRHLSLDETATASLPLAFCGIARPRGFFAMLNAKGVMPVASIEFPDHHRYTAQDIADLLERARHCGANGFVTTEKDAVKLTPAMREHLEAVGPLCVARLHLELIDEKEALKQLVSQVERLDRRRRR